jgi:guanylate kinase
LLREIVEAISYSDSMSIIEQYGMLENLARADQIFNANLAQQNAIVNQQVIFQIELAALAKCVQVLLASNLSEPQAVEQLTARMLDMFEQFNSKAEERLAASHKQMDDLLNKMRAHAAKDKPGES